jgi:hypothetical protein
MLMSDIRGSSDLRFSLDYLISFEEPVGWSTIFLYFPVGKL